MSPPANSAGSRKISRLCSSTQLVAPPWVWTCCSSPSTPILAAGEWRLRLDQWARQMFSRFDRHPWALEATGGLSV
jgi:hypothetical protein